MRTQAIILLFLATSILAANQVEICINDLTSDIALIQKIETDANNGNVLAVLQDIIDYSAQITKTETDCSAITIQDILQYAFIHHLSPAQQRCILDIFSAIQLIQAIQADCAQGVSTTCVLDVAKLALLGPAINNDCANSSVFMKLK